MEPSAHRIARSPHLRRGPERTAGPAPGSPRDVQGSCGGKPPQPGPHPAAEPVARGLPYPSSSGVLEGSVAARRGAGGDPAGPALGVPDRACGGRPSRRPAFAETAAVSGAGVRPLSGRAEEGSALVFTDRLWKPGPCCATLPEARADTRPKATISRVSARLGADTSPFENTWRGLAGEA